MPNMVGPFISSSHGWSFTKFVPIGSKIVGIEKKYTHVVGQALLNRLILIECKIFWSLEQCRLMTGA